MGQYENWKALLIESFEQFTSILGAYLPNLLGALVLMIAGVVTAWLCRWVIIRLGQGVDQMTQRLSIGTQYLQLRWPVSRITAGIVYWLIILFFITAAAESLGLPGLAEWLGQLIIYLPSLLVALLLVWFGIILGNVIREKLTTAAQTNNLLHAEELAESARLAVIILTVAVGLEQIGVEMKLVEHLIIVIVGAIFFALALSFGIGAGPAVMNVIATSSVKQRYQTGDKIQIDNITGEILLFTRTAIILSTDSGQVTIPARIFHDKASILLNIEETDDG